jgi:hypothetical protein
MSSHIHLWAFNDTTNSSERMYVEGKCCGLLQDTTVDVRRDWVKPRSTSVFGPRFVHTASLIEAGLPTTRSRISVNVFKQAYVDRNKLTGIKLICREYNLFSFWECLTQHSERTLHVVLLPLIFRNICPSKMHITILVQSDAIFQNCGSIRRPEKERL